MNLKENNSRVFLLDSILEENHAYAKIANFTKISLALELFWTLITLITLLRKGKT